MTPAQCPKDQPPPWEDASLGAPSAGQPAGGMECAAAQRSVRWDCVLKNMLKGVVLPPDNKVVYRKDRAEKCVFGRHAILWTGCSLVVRVSFCSGYIIDRLCEFLDIEWVPLGSNRAGP